MVKPTLPALFAASEELLSANYKQFSCNLVPLVAIGFLSN
jgi:hypothetical protein